jgi:hypothetical protein
MSSINKMNLALAAIISIQVVCVVVQAIRLMKRFGWL